MKTCNCLKKLIFYKTRVLTLCPGQNIQMISQFDVRSVAGHLLSDQCETMTPSTGQHVVDYLLTHNKLTCTTFFHNIPH